MRHIQRSWSARAAINGIITVIRRIVTNNWNRFISSEKMNDLIVSCLKANFDKIKGVSDFIYENPELGFKEFKAAQYLRQVLLSEGFFLTHYEELPTALKGEFGFDEGPVIAVNCEYDCLPGGHLCGHNLIAACGIAIAFCLKDIISSLGYGKIVVLGTPAEEGGGGKQILVDLSAYEQVDICLMAHGGIQNQAYYYSLATGEIEIEFVGKAAHAAASPWEGVNALDAAVMTYNAISVARQQMYPTDRVHCKIVDGGKATNVIHEKSAITFQVRGPSSTRVKELLGRIQAAADGAARSTGCKVYYKLLRKYDEMNVMTTLCDELEKILSDLGIEDLCRPPAAGSTDQGNVSQIVPSIHPKFKIPSKGNIHTKEFGEAAKSLESFQSAMLYAEAISRLAHKLLVDEEYMHSVKTEFAGSFRN